MTFTYTRVNHNIDSSFVDVLWYNENTQTALVVLDTDNGAWAYQYEGVDPEGFKALESANSVGAHYNTTFKPTYGPSVSDALATSILVMHEPVEVKIAKVNDVSATAEFSLGTAPAAATSTDATKEFSLGSADETPVSAVTHDVDSDEDVDFWDDLDLAKAVVHYTLNGKPAKFLADADDLWVAIDELHVITERLGISSQVKIVKVVFKFV